MKILCVIDHFGSGGAQRQMINLACGLRRRGHDVDMFVYYPQFDFFRHFVDRQGVQIHSYSGSKMSWMGVLASLIRVVRTNKYGAIVSFLNTPNLYAELASVVSPSTKLIVSERSSYINDGPRGSAAVRRHLHRLADHVVTNSHDHRKWLEQHHRWLANKCVTIYNGLDASLFTRRAKFVKGETFRFVSVGRLGIEKSVDGLIHGLDEFGIRHGWVPHVDWIGRREASSSESRAYCEGVDRLLADKPAVGSVWTWLGERTDVPALLPRYDGLIHASLFEGLPNAICEAFATGLPVLASNVCDNAQLVEEGVRGFLFDPRNPASIADALERLVFLSPVELNQLSSAASDYAREVLSLERMIVDYERLLLA